MTQPVDPFIPIKRRPERPQSTPMPMGLKERKVTPPATLIAKPTKRSRSIPVALQVVAASMAIIGAGILLQVAYAGELMIGLYALWLFIKHGSSRTPFILALVSFGTILVMLLIRPDPLLMKNFALYAFLFLIIGTASMLREAHD